MNFIPNKKSLLANVGDDLHCLTADTLLDCRRYVYDSSTGIQIHGSYPAGTLKVTGGMRRADDGTCLYYAYFYDVMGNVVKTVSSDIRGEQEIMETDWLFTGQPLVVRRSRTGHPETYTYTYDVTATVYSVWTTRQAQTPTAEDLSSGTAQGRLQSMLTTPTAIW